MTDQAAPTTPTLTIDDVADRATLRIEEAAEILNIGRFAAYAAAKSGDLPTIRMGRRILVPVARLRALLGADA